MRLVYLLALASVISACQNFSENSMYDGATAAFRCPANGCANQAASKNDISISYPGRTPILSPTSDSSVSIGGDCHPSTFPSNSITVQVYNGSTLIPVAVSALGPNGIHCEKGRFNFVVDGSGLAVNQNYTVRVELIAYDSANVEQRSTNGVVDIRIARF